MEPDTTWLSSPFLNKQRVTWRGTMETESSNTRQGVERRKSNAGQMLTSKHGSKAIKGQGCHRWVRPQVLWGAQAATPDQLRVRSTVRGSQHQRYRTGTHCSRAALSSTLFSQGMKAKQQRIFNGNHWWWTSCDTWQVPHSKPQRNGNHCKCHRV